MESEKVESTATATPESAAQPVDPEPTDLEAPVEPEAATTAQQPPPPKKYPDKMSKEDRLEVENIALQMRVLQGQVQNCDLTKNGLVTQMKDLQLQMEKLSNALSVKYGIDIRRNTVAADGTIIRTPPKKG
jgi:hypothetical protein